MDQYDSGRYEEVVEITSGLIGEGENRYEIFQLKALSEIQLGRTDRAIATLQQALVVFPQDVRLLKILAGQYFDAGDYVQAEALYSELVATDRSDQSSWLKLAEIYSFRQIYTQAIKALEKVLAIDSLNLNSLMMMGELLERLNKSDAVLYYQRARKIYPENQKAAYALGNWYIQAKEPWKTVSLCEQVLLSDSSSIKFRKLLGYAFYKNSEPEPAIPQFQRAVVLGDSTAFTFKFMGICHYLSVNFSDAIKSLDLAAIKDSMDAEIHFFLGASLATTTRKMEAMKHLNKSLQLLRPEPGIISRIYSEQGNIKRLEMEYEEAYALYEKAWKADSTNAMSLYLMASILDNSLHRSEEALVDYQRYLDVLEKLPPSTRGSGQGISIKSIVEDRIMSLKEERFFLDQPE